MSFIEKMIVFVCEIDTYQSVLAGLSDTYLKTEPSDREKSTKGQCS
ncbi:MAG: hypothetical protein ACK5MF_06505 [Vibrio sp.]